ncbi:RNA methyltransferase [Chlorobium sp. N1]|uniref:RNA methyltransferase n=1 Tax=Chlorobium sp. N1 TaxID=2491138 RepID=UPI00103989BF|nr:RNA methyltransferase [Chlorobium sp. N1]TCD47157.1 TrmH family RNA methyltransferase [Chlorobium sp. N1]
MPVFRKLEGREMRRTPPGAYASRAPHSIVLLLHNIRSMWNVGSMFRTADCAGIEKILLSGYTATPPRKEISKTALGAEESMPWEYLEDPKSALVGMKADGRRVYGLEITEGSRPYTELSLEDFPLCLVLGNEVGGIDDGLLEVCDGVLEIPQYGTKHSLNVSVAAGVALFELVRVLRGCG